MIDREKTCRIKTEITGSNNELEAQESMKGCWFDSYFTSMSGAPARCYCKAKSSHLYRNYPSINYYYDEKIQIQNVSVYSTIISS